MMIRVLRSHQLPCRAESAVPRAGLRTCRAAGAPPRSVPECELRTVLRPADTPGCAADHHQPAVSRVYTMSLSCEEARQIYWCLLSTCSVACRAAEHRGQQVFITAKLPAQAIIQSLQYSAVRTWPSMSGLLLASCTCALARAAQASMSWVARVGSVSSVAPKRTSCRAPGTVCTATVLHSGAQLS
jgi:hypothetical protein